MTAELTDALGGAAPQPCLYGRGRACCPEGQPL